MANDANNTQKDNGDWSLRANGSTYYDNNTISAKLTKRLKNSSSSVIGIAGRRGVGKSSLAQRVLDNLEGSESFTLLIHSPTKYDPQEYLVTLFQAVCEKVVERVNSDFGEVNSLLKRGKTELIPLNRTHKILLVLLLVGGFIVSFFAGAFTGDVGLSEISVDDYLLPLVVVVIALILNLIAIFVLVRYVLPLGKKIRIARANPEKTGLRRTALHFSEHLRFQTTLARSSEVGLFASKIGAKFGIGKSLATRPLTLPSLAKQFTQFLNDIHEVYSGGPVVICLDELDKIENPQDLDALLRGIKGILGQSGMHFLLTVSEDALTKFNEQRQMKRGILESAFEDIVHLDQIELKSTNKIVEPMYCKSDRANTEGGNEVSTELLWLFGNAIPREIKRTALVCLEKGCSPKTSPPEKVWILLFKARIEDMKTWAINAGGENSIRQKFIKKLGESSRFLEDVTKAPLELEWGSYLTMPWVELFKQTFIDNQNSNAIKTEYISYGGAIIEILLGASALVYVLDDDQKNLSDGLIEDQLSEIFRFMSISPEFAWDLMQKYLADINIINYDLPKSMLFR